MSIIQIPAGQYLPHCMDAMMVGAYVLRLSQEHVARSLQEPGCLRHEVMPDLANPKRLVFVEQWASAEDLFRHFKVPASVAFARAMATLAVAMPEIKVYEANELPLPAAPARTAGER